MEADLATLEPVPDLPGGFRWTPWDDSTLQTHALVKWRSFQGEVDTRIFPNLSHLEGCVHLMRSIRDVEGFLPGATWLIASPEECCGTVQGIAEKNEFGVIQNLGVLQEYRGRGLGQALLMKALHGFRQAGLRRAFLEVTARNSRAMRLYHRAGFMIQKTLYRELSPDAVEEYRI